VKYLDMLKKEKNVYPNELQKPQKDLFTVFTVPQGKGFPEKKVPSGGACPLITGGPVPRGCRFEPKFFKRMVRDRVLELTEPCPVQRACRIIDK